MPVLRGGLLLLCVGASHVERLTFLAFAERFTVSQALVPAFHPITVIGEKIPLDIS